MINIPSPFTQNQINYLYRTQFSWLNVAEGGKRGGKNVLQVLAFCMALQNHPNKLHLIAGVSQTTAKLNIVDCDGFGLMNFFDGKCRQGKYNDRSALFVQTKNGEKVILVSGGAKDGDEKYIKGNTYGMAYVTEANECHPNFIQEVFDRTLSSFDRKIFHDLNPKAEQHWYYTNVLNFHEENQFNNKNYGYNYGHFTIADNLSIDNEKLRKILLTYQKDTVWYERDILGKRKTAEGIVFPDFANNPKNYLIDKKELPRVFREVGMGYDLGGNTSNFALVATGITLDNKAIVLRTQEILPEDLKLQDVEKAAIKFIEGIEEDFKIKVNYCYIDDNYYTTVNSLNDWRYIFDTAAHIKSIMPLEDRPFMLSKLMAQGRFKLVKGECNSLIEQLQNVVYDEKSDKAVIADDGSQNIDLIDGLFYSLANSYLHLSE